MSDVERFYYYAYSFSHSDGLKITTASVYMGQRANRVTMQDIKEAKEGATMPSNSVLVSCCYLGHMTKEEFMAEPQSAPEPDAAGDGA